MAFTAIDALRDGYEVYPVVDAIAGLLGSFVGALPDLHAAEQDIVAENDLVVVRLVVTATVRGSLPERRPTASRSGRVSRTRPAGRPGWACRPARP
jgi:SnoaL-like polyketide cyclase